MIAIDWDGEEFYPSVDRAHEIMLSELDKFEKNTKITVNAIGHTHIDVAWLWRLKHTREKAQRSFATVLRLMEQYDEYVFLQTQPQLYQYIKEDCPKMYEKIKAKVAEGKWEAAGGMWVEADCNLSSGESLVRQLLFGTRFFEREFGKKCEYLWLPDVFGYSWALPQILRQCEIDTFMTTKISWNQYNTIPDDLFRWRGIDGTEILTYFVDTPEVGQTPKQRFSTYNGLMTPHVVIGNWKKSFYTISWTGGGQLNRIYDKKADREVLRKGQEGNVLELYEDKPMGNDAWDIDIFYTEKMTKVNIVKEPELVACGPVRAVVRFSYRYHRSSFTQDMIVYAHSGRIDFVTHADWHEDHKLLKAAFYTDIRSTKAAYDIQFGHVERSTHWNNSWDWAKFEVCGHKWADLSETGYGVSLLNNCKYGYSIKDNAMKLSLLRAPKHPDTDADMGEHDFTYSLYPHTGSAVSGGTIEEANQLNLPARVIAGSFTDTRQIVRLSDASVQIDAVKKAEDEECLIVRMHECRGGRSSVTLTSDYPVKRFVPCNLLEHDTGEAVEENRVALVFRPFEIKTYKMYF